MSTFISKTTSEQELNLLLEQMDGWDVEDELQVDTVPTGFLCRFEFPDGDPRVERILAYLHAHPCEWLPVKNGTAKRVAEE